MLETARSFAILLPFLWVGCAGVIDDAASSSEGSNGGASRAGSLGAGGRPDPGAAPGATPGPVGPLPSAALAPKSGLRRLTSWEFDNTLRDLIDDRSRPGRQILPEDPRSPFDNDYGVQAASTALIEGLELLATEAAARLIQDKARLARVLGCTPSGPTDAACLGGFLARFGRRALRRPLTAEEITRAQTALGKLAADAKDFNVAVRAAVEMFLQHPELLYRVEIGAPVPGNAGLFRLNGFEVGARLAYLLWGSPPDDWLLDQAQAGALATSEGVRGAATRMLKDKRGQELLARFHAQWLGYDTAPLAPDQAAAMVAETSALITRVVLEEQRPWQDLLRIDETFITDALAKHYRMRSPGAAAAWVKYGTDGRRGLLGHGTFLAVGAKFDDSSPTMRGIAVRERLLCQKVPPPPPEVNADEPPPPTPEARCKEDRYAMHREGGCAGCHRRIDSIGFGLERFDHLGRYRTVEAKDATCQIRGAGEIDAVKFSGPGELGDLLIKSPDLKPCAVSQLVRFAVGRSQLDDTDSRVAAELADRLGAKTADFRLHELLLDLVSSEAFRNRRQD